MNEVQEMTVEQITDKFNSIIAFRPVGVDPDSYAEGVYQSLLVFCSVDSPALSALILLKIEAQIITDVV